MRMLSGRSEVGTFCMLAFLFNVQREHPLSASMDRQSSHFLGAMRGLRCNEAGANDTCAPRTCPSSDQTVNKCLVCTPSIQISINRQLS
jgi:hypothetical protein